VVVAYSLCPQKAFLLLCTEETGTVHEYEQILQQQKRATQSQALKAILPTKLDSRFSTLDALTSAGDMLVNATLLIEGLEAVCGLLTKVGQPSSLGEYCYEPAIFVGTYCVTKEHKLELLFVGYVLGKIQGKAPEHGKIIAASGSAHHVKLGQSDQLLLPLLRPLHTWASTSAPQPPPLILNKHCSSCQFQDLCRARAGAGDHLSLLSNITRKDVHYYGKKGIFTVKQLSYLYKPKRPGKQTKSRPARHKPTLQALAIRTGKIYVHQLPTFSRQAVELFVDIE
jgi:predicted RecB family nuclease